MTEHGLFVHLGGWIKEELHHFLNVRFEKSAEDPEEDLVVNIL